MGKKGKHLRKAAEISNTTSGDREVDSLCGKVNLLEKKFSNGFEEMNIVLYELNTKKEELRAAQDNWNSLEKRITDNIKKMDTTVKLNIRGKLFETMKDNLVRQPGSYFHTLVGSGHWQPAKDGAYFIDAPSEGFGRILEYMATGEMCYEGLNVYELKMIKKNIDYFQLDIPTPDDDDWASY